jgi:hypothetical protein
MLPGGRTEQAVSGVVFVQNLPEYRTKPACHSEQSEESSATLLAISKWILRFAQNDRKETVVLLNRLNSASS